MLELVTNRGHHSRRVPTCIDADTEHPVWPGNRHRHEQASVKTRSACARLDVDEPVGAIDRLDEAPERGRPFDGVVQEPGDGRVTITTHPHHRRLVRSSRASLSGTDAAWIVRADAKPRPVRVCPVDAGGAGALPEDNPTRQCQQGQCSHVVLTRLLAACGRERVGRNAESRGQLPHGLGGGRPRRLSFMDLTEGETAGISRLLRALARARRITKDRARKDA
jgi:hypothetical protein